jgi:hypothetical protein
VLRVYLVLGRVAMCSKLSFRVTGYMTLKYLVQI